MTLLNNSLKERSKPKKSKTMEIKYFTPDGEQYNLSKETVEELKLRECFEPTIQTTSYEIKPKDEKYKCFEKYFNNISKQAKEIIFFNKVYPNSKIEIGFVTKMIEKDFGKDNTFQVIHRDSFNERKLVNSAEFIAIIYS